LQEAQHQVEESGGVWDHIQFVHCDWKDVPDLTYTVVWVDPAVTSTDESDSMGIQADGIDQSGVIYRLYSWEAVTSPEDALRRAVLKGIELGAHHVGVETDQGGDTWQSVYWRVTDQIRKERPGVVMPSFASAKAGAGHGGKVERNARMLADYERGQVVHVRGTHEALERSLKRFPQKPLDLADAGYWGWDDLRNRRSHGGIHV
jgi:phage terminase large subunit-like protein